MFLAVTLAFKLFLFYDGKDVITSEYSGTFRQCDVIRGNRLHISAFQLTIIAQKLRILLIERINNQFQCQLEPLHGVTFRRSPNLRCLPFTRWNSVMFADVLQLLSKSEIEYLT